MTKIPKVKKMSKQPNLIIFNMITKEDYLAAMSVVEEYHNQLKKAIAMAARTGTPIREFILGVEVSPRLRRALDEFMEMAAPNQLFLEEIDDFDLRKFRNVGRLSRQEFIEKREKFLLQRRL